MSPRIPPPVSQHIPYEMCRNVIRGKWCSFGVKCSFAHSEDELKEWNLYRVRTPRKIPGEYKLCWNMQNEQYCTWGKKCGFAHSDVELEIWNQCFPIERQKYLRSLSEDGEQQSEDLTFKSQVCTLFLDTVSS